MTTPNNINQSHVLKHQAEMLDQIRFDNLMMEGECYCSVFGCGAKLTPQEQLFGNRCQGCSIQTAKVDPTRFIHI